MSDLEKAKSELISEMNKVFKKIEDKYNVDITTEPANVTITKKIGRKANKAKI